jgi:hypothetical protein
MQRYFHISRLLFSISIFVIILVACGLDVAETSDSDLASLNGKVVDKVMGGGVVGATISVSSLVATSDQNGAYRINGLVDGVHELIIQMDGYALSKEPLEVSSGESLHRQTLLIR